MEVLNKEDKKVVCLNSFYIYSLIRFHNLAVTGQLDLDLPGY